MVGLSSLVQPYHTFPAGMAMENLASSVVSIWEPDANIKASNDITD
jgi:hypothetical protein